jgi:hypothetical protein
MQGSHMNTLGQREIVIALKPLISPQLFFIHDDLDIRDQLDQTYLYRTRRGEVGVLNLIKIHVHLLAFAFINEAEIYIL